MKSQSSDKKIRGVITPRKEHERRQLFLLTFSSNFNISYSLKDLNYFFVVVYNYLTFDDLGSSSLKFNIITLGVPHCFHIQPWQLVISKIIYGSSPVKYNSIKSVSKSLDNLKREFIFHSYDKLRIEMFEKDDSRKNKKRFINFC